jgi:hypothetical protein
MLANVIRFCVFCFVFLLCNSELLIEIQIRGVYVRIALAC